MARLQEDNELAFEADKTGMIHVRKKLSETEVLPGYGTTNFGVSPFEEKELITTDRIIIGTALISAAAMIWKFKDQIYTYALLLRESRK